MESEIEKTIELIKVQKNIIIKEIENNPTNIDRNNILIKNL